MLSFKKNKMIRVFYKFNPVRHAKIISLIVLKLSLASRVRIRSIRDWNRIEFKKS